MSDEAPLNMLVAGSAQTRNVAVKYCPVCSAPFEYCEWGPDFKKCKAWFAENWQSVYPDVEEDGLLELMTKLGFEGEADKNAQKAQATKKAAPEPAPEALATEAEADPPPETKKEKKKKEAAAIVIELNTRNKKKFTTCIRGLELFEVDAPAAAKVFGKKFACGSAFQKGKNGLPDKVEIQGNYKEELPAFLASKFGIPLECIFALEGGKKVPIGETTGD
ncbi:hypothetical protein AB1Y20_002849 [Prymnesium parvum]|uniref:SUI1 domain-containing protein n=1 Tax=Prymnesium parvum TaxID=97485 RepID=A0AB34JAJ4_PRYPA